jgi:hypothetical protein
LEPVLKNVIRMKSQVRKKFAVERRAASVGRIENEKNRENIWINRSMAGMIRLELRVKPPRDHRSICWENS